MTDILKLFDDLAARKEPEAGDFFIPVKVQALTLIGNIIVQWGHLQKLIAFETVSHRANVPERLSQWPLRNETKYKIDYLIKAAPFFLAGKRPEALPLYVRNLNRILNHKGMRDAIAHGTYSLEDNESFEGAVVHYKTHKYYLTYARLHQIGTEIGRCAAFLLSFWHWVEAAQHKDLLESLLQKLPGHGQEQNAPGTSDTP